MQKSLTKHFAHLAVNYIIAHLPPHTRLMDRNTNFFNKKIPRTREKAIVKFYDCFFGLLRLKRSITYPEIIQIRFVSVLHIKAYIILAYTL